MIAYLYLIISILTTTYKSIGYLHTKFYIFSYNNSRHSKNYLKIYYLLYLWLDMETFNFEMITHFLYHFSAIIDMSNGAGDA